MSSSSGAVSSGWWYSGGSVGTDTEVPGPNRLLNRRLLRLVDYHDHVVGAERGRAAAVLQPSAV